MSPEPSEIEGVGTPRSAAWCCRFLGLFKDIFASWRCWRRCGTFNIAAYLLDVLTFYFLLCYRPFGIQFHIETSLFNVFFSKLDRGTVKPVRWNVSESQLDQVKSFGVKKFEDFAWKHMLDFYSCADAGVAPTIARRTLRAVRRRLAPHHEGARLLLPEFSRVW